MIRKIGLIEFAKTSIEFAKIDKQNQGYSFEWRHRQSIILENSISREAIENGALFLADNLVSKKVGLYNFKNILLPFYSA